MTLTLGQLLDLSYMGHMILISMRLDERNTMVPKIIPLACFVQKLFTKNKTKQNSRKLRSL